MSGREGQEVLCVCERERERERRRERKGDRKKERLLEDFFRQIITN